MTFHHGGGCSSIPSVDDSTQAWHRLPTLCGHPFCHRNHYERSQEIFRASNYPSSPVRYLDFRAQLRKSSQDSASAKTKDAKSQPAPVSAPPPPPPNTAKPLPQPVPAVQGLPGASVNNSTNHSLPSQAQASYNRGPPPAPAQSSTPDRRYNSNQSSPIPPIVVVSSDPAPEPAPRSGQFGSPERTSLGLDLPGSNPTPPRATTLNRLRSGPRDTIPIVGKPPRKQRSSRFIVTEKVEIERLAPFAGLFFSSPSLPCLFNHPPSEVPPSERSQLFVRKLTQCRVLFDFNDASAELKGKQIKAQTLHEMLEYITTQRGVITENIYPEVVNMVGLLGTCQSRHSLGPVVCC